MCTRAWYKYYRGLVHGLPGPGTTITRPWYMDYQMVVMNLVNGCERCMGFNKKEKGAELGTFLAFGM